MNEVEQKQRVVQQQEQNEGNHEECEEQKGQRHFDDEDEVIWLEDEGDEEGQSST